MTKLTTLLLLFLGTSALAQTPDYFANNPTWYCSHWNSGQWDSPPLEYNEEYVYYLNGDTTALGHTWHRVFRRGYRNYDYTETLMDVVFNEQTPYYIRQEGRTIRYFIRSMNVDNLLVDYNLEVGSVVSEGIFSDCHSGETVQKVDSILVNSEYRRVFYLDTLSGPVVYEGIGHQNFLSGNSGDFLGPLCEGIGFENYINCYGQNNIPLWGADGNGGNCYLNVGLEKENELSFEIVPNPASTQFSMIGMFDKPLQIELRNMSGNLVRRSDMTTLSVEDLGRGVYLVVITGDSGSRAVKRLVVN